MILEEFATYIESTYPVLQKIDESFEDKIKEYPQDSNKLKLLKLKTRKALELVEFMNEELPSEAVWLDYVRLIKEILVDVKKLNKRES